MSQVPDRLLGRHPRFTGYLILAMAFVIFALTVWAYNLNGRVTEGEAFRRSDQKNTEERRQLGCTFVLTIVDVAIDTPVANITDQLRGNTLTAKERVDRIQARARYLAKKKKLKTVLEGCVR